MKSEKLRNIAFCLVGIFLLGITTVTVNAFSDNAIVNTVKEIVPMMCTANDTGEEKDITCEKLDNGHMSCTEKVKSDTGDFEVTVEYEPSIGENSENTIDFEYVEFPN